MLPWVNAFEGCKVLVAQAHQLVGSLKQKALIQGVSSALKSGSLVK